MAGNAPRSNALFWESPEAQIALDEFMSGDGEAPADFWRMVGDLAEKRAEVTGLLARHDLTLDELEDLRARVNDHRAQAVNGPGSNELAAAARQLLVRNFSAEQVAALLNLPEEDIAEYTKRTRLRDETPAVLQLHRQGKPAADIASALDVPLTNVRRILTGLGLDPIAKNNRPLTEAQKRVVRELRAEGCSQYTIATRLGVTRDQVRYYLKGAA